MADRRRNLGGFGEQAAAAYLVRQGYTLLARGWRCAGGEIDLVMRDGAALVFVEVRTRRNAEIGAAIESIGPRKRARLIALAYTYLATLDATPEPSWRIDVVGVVIDRAGRIADLEHIRDAIEEC